MATLPTVKVIAGGVTYTGTVTANSNRTKATVTLSSDIPTGAVQVEVSGGADYAGFGIEKVTKSLNVVAPTTAPTATITEVKDRQVTIKFDRPIKAGTFDGNANAYIRHTYNTSLNEVVGTDASSGGPNVTNPSLDNQTFVIDFAAPLAPGNSTVYVGLLDTANAAIEDNFGNKFVNSSYTVNLNADTTKPVVNNIEVTDSQTIKVVYSEKVLNDATTNGAKNTSNYILKDKDGKQIAITSIADAKTPVDDMSFEIKTATGAIEGGNYTLEVKNIVDQAVAQNKIDTVTKSFAAADKLAPTVTTAGEVINATKVRIKFSEAMDTASITDKTNYNVDNKVKFTAANDKKSVVLDYSDVAGTNFTSGGPTIITVGRVKDVAGNMTTSFSTAVNVNHSVSTIGMKEAQVTELDKAVVIIEDVMTIDPGAKLAVAVGGTGIPADTQWEDATVASSQVIDGKTHITVTLPTPITTDTALSTKVYVATGTVNSSPVSLTQGASTTIKNADGLALDIVGTAAKDKVGPVITTRTTGDSDKNGKIDEVTFTFSEPIYASTVAASDFAVDDYTVKGVKEITSTTVTLELQEGIFDTNATPKVRLVGPVSDINGNSSKTETASIASTDAAAPVLVASTISAPGVTAGFGTDVADELTLVFSEPVNTNFGTATAPTIAELAAIFEGTAGVKFTGNTTFTATDLSVTAGNTLKLVVATTGTTPMTAINVDDVFTTAATPTANDIEDILNKTIAAKQSNVTVK